jgi:hypothetical protein
MAKRTRYANKPSVRPAARRAAKPATPAAGIIRATSRPAGDDAPLDLGEQLSLRSASALTEAEIARAAQLEAEALAQERAAIAESLRRRARGQAGEDRHATGDVNAPLSVRMSHEYDYVARDVKRIALTASLMVAILAILHILVNVLGVITL